MHCLKRKGRTWTDFVYLAFPQCNDLNLWYIIIQINIIAEVDYCTKSFTSCLASTFQWMLKILFHYSVVRSTSQVDSWTIKVHLLQIYDKNTDKSYIVFTYTSQTNPSLIDYPLPVMLHSSLNVGVSPPYPLMTPWLYAVGTGMVTVIGLWNFLLLGSMVTIGLTITRFPSTFLTTSPPTGWA